MSTFFGVPQYNDQNLAAHTCPFCFILWRIVVLADELQAVNWKGNSEASSFYSSNLHISDAKFK